MKKKVKKESSPEYVATIKVLGRVYESKGPSVKEAIQNLKPVGTPRGMSVLTVSKGEVKKEKILNTSQTYNLFTVSRIMHEIAMKNILSLFGNL